MRASNCIPILLGAALISLAGCLGEPTDEWGGSDDTQDKVAGDSVEKSYVGDLGMVLGSPVAFGNTSLLDNNYHPSCVFNSLAPDASYKWTAPFGDVFVFDTMGSIFDTVLEIRRVSNGVPLGCNNNSGGTLQSSVSTFVAAGDSVIVYIDGYRAAASRYRLSINN